MLWKVWAWLFLAHLTLRVHLLLDGRKQCWCLVGRSCRAFLRLSSLVRQGESLLERDPTPLVGHCRPPATEAPASRGRAGCQPRTPVLDLLCVCMDHGHLPLPDAEHDSPAHPAPSTHPTCCLPLVFFCPEGLGQTSKSGQICWSDNSYLLSTMTP